MWITMKANQKMIVKTILLSLSFAATSCFAQNRKIEFETSSFADIKAKAKKENRMIFIDAYAEWCGPCKWMSANIFTNDTVADYFNAKFVNAKIDMEKGEGPEIAKLYEVYCYPNLLFIDGDGKLIHRGAGSSDAKTFIKLAEDAQNPEKRFSKYKDEYESRKSDPKFLYEYLNIISQTCLPFNDVVIGYFNTVKDEDLTSQVNWNIIRDYTSDYKSREFIYLINNIEKFNKLYTADSVNTKIKNTLMRSGYNLVNKPDLKEEDYIAFKSEISKFNTINVDEILFHLDMSYYSNKEDWKNFVDLAVKEGDKYFNDIHEFNQVSWYIYLFSDDISALQKAESWMQKALEAEENQPSYALDTYASILYKLNKKTEAKAAALKAIETAKSNGVSEDEYKSTLELLQKIEMLE
jgi:thiol-disulfide isomerase/thioredoxin